MTYYTTIESPIGDLLLTSDGERLTGIVMAPAAPAPGWRDDRGPLASTIEQLGEYFAGDRTHFGLELAPVGTPFQMRVWNALSDIPYGKTISYGELARRIDNPRAVRAVGRANGANPIPIVVPCHRVIAANGTLHGYGGGVDRKATLLALEGVSLQASEKPRDPRLASLG